VGSCKFLSYYFRIELTYLLEHCKLTQINSPKETKTIIPSPLLTTKKTKK
jgi:hypothetical protein